MKNIRKRLYAITLGCVALLGSFSGCQKKENGTGQLGENGKSEETLVFGDGIHNYQVTETTKDFVKNSVSSYKIVMKENASEMLQFAAEDLQLLFKEATGVTLPIVTENTVDYAQDAKIISLGANGLLESAGLTTDENVLSRNGFIIKTKGDNVFIAGAYDEGTMFGVYGFLEQYFHFDCFSNTCYYIDTEMTDVKWKEFDVVDVPDLKVRNCGNDFITSDTRTERRMRYTKREDGSTFLGSASAHTVFNYLDPEVYAKFSCLNETEHTCYVEAETGVFSAEQYPDCIAENYHPDWFSNDLSQLCYTAHGNTEERNAMLETALEEAKKVFIANPNAYLWTFSQMDRYTWCACETCRGYKTKYNGSNAAVVVMFCNDLADKISAWMETEEGKPYARDFKILFLAYNATLTPPAKYNEATGEYEKIDDTVVCNEHTAVMFAPIEMDFQLSIYDEANDSFYEAFQGWMPISKTFNIYSYQSNYNYFFVPYDCFNTMPDFYQYAAKANTYWFFELGQRKQTAGATGWQILKNYISSKLAWNVNLDVNELTDKFFDVYFGEAADIMRDWYNSYRIHSKYLIDYAGAATSSSVYHPILDKKYWSNNLLDSWIKKSEEALQAIDHLRYEDEARYQKLYDRITMERLSPYYMLIELYEIDYEATYIQTLKETVKYDCNRLGLNHAGESASNALATIWSKWGIA